MQKTNIEWTDYSWNPIKGLCPVGCFYCYARRMYQRFGWNPKLRLDPEEKSKFGTALSIITPKKASKIFVCSTIELFHPEIKKHWRAWIFREIERNPQHTFQILTKFPQNIDRVMPDNVWLGVSVTEHDEVNRIETLIQMRSRIKFVSIEPFLEPLYISAENLLQNMDWIIIGRLTGHGKKDDPRQSSIKGIETFAKNRKIPIFLKNNLNEIWGEPLIQEFPNEEGK